MSKDNTNIKTNENFKRCEDCKYDGKCNSCPLIAKIMQELEDDFYLTQVLGIPLS